jgi:hypothetical protein
LNGRGRGLKEETKCGGEARGETRSNTFTHCHEDEAKQGTHDRKVHLEGGLLGLLGGLLRVFVAGGRGETVRVVVKTFAGILLKETPTRPCRPCGIVDEDKVQKKDPTLRT